MKVVNPEVEVTFYVPEDGKTPEQAIEAAGRTCYKSEDRITDESAPKFVRMVRERGHHAMLEFGYATARIIADRGLTHELVRHRLASFAQECVSGDMKVRKDLTVRELFQRHQSPTGRGYNRRLHIKSVTPGGEIVPNHIVDVWSKGKKPVFRVVSRLGYTTKTTGNHRFCLPGGGEKELSKLVVGDQVLVNGRPCLLKVADNTLFGLYLKQGLSPKEIAEECGAPYASVLRRLKYLGIFEKHLNDKDPDKYNSQRNPDSVRKMQETILEQYRTGRTPRNKGVKEGEHPSVDLQADSLRTHHHSNGIGEGNSNWKEGASRRTAYREKRRVTLCELCGVGDLPLEVHHADSNPHNNKPSNLIKCCRNCHSKLHRGWFAGKVAHSDEIIRIEPAGEEEVFDIEMQSPFHNFVGDGFVTHNSTRYCNYGKGKFGEEITVVQQPGLNEEQQKVWEGAMKRAEAYYLELLGFGVPPQIARSVLPIGLKSEIVIGANLREWRHIFKMRCDTPAHPIIRGVMLEVLRQFHEKMPSLYEDQAVEFLSQD